MYIVNPARFGIFVLESRGVFVESDRVCQDIFVQN